MHLNVAHADGKKAPIKRVARCVMVEMDSRPGINADQRWSA